MRMRKKLRKKAREQQTVNRMADGVNITVEAHWRRPVGGEQCDSTNVATGISEHHSTFTGVLFGVSCIKNGLKTNTLQPLCSCVFTLSTTVMQVKHKFHGFKPKNTPRVGLKASYNSWYLY